MAELTVESLAKRLDDLEKQNSELAEGNAKLAASNNELQESNAKLAATSENLQKTIGAATSLEVGAKFEKPTIPEGSVKVDKKEYKFTVALFYPPNATEPITAKEASTDDKLLAEIVKIKGQNILKEVL